MLFVPFAVVFPIDFLDAVSYADATKYFTFCIFKLIAFHSTGGFNPQRTYASYISTTRHLS